MAEMPAMRSGIAWEAALEAPDVRRRPAHVDHDRVVELRQEGGAAHAVGRARREGVDGMGLGLGGQHHRAIVLGEIERRGRHGLLAARGHERGEQGAETHGSISSDHMDVV
jgi:hypothetical protein